MAFFSDTSSVRPGLLSRVLADIEGGFSAVSAVFARYREYARAEAELRGLSDRELADIGVARSDIRQRVWSDFQ